MRNAFTLIELIVVISIMGVLGLVAFANFGSLRDDATLKKATADLQSKLRSIQTDASSNTKCNGNSALSWKGTFSKVSSTEYKLTVSCEYAGVPDSIVSGKTYTFEPNIEIANVVSGNCPTDLVNPVSVSFASLTGKVTFKYLTACNPGAQMLIDLLNIKTPGTLSTVIIDQGGSIYVRPVE